MAVQLVVELLSEALLDAASQYRSKLSARTVEIIDWLREVAEPPAGVELRSSDGSTYSGIALFERSDLKLMLAVRHPPTPAPAPRPPLAAPSLERSLYHRMPDPDDPRWDRDGDPFRR